MKKNWLYLVIIFVLITPCSLGAEEKENWETLFSNTYNTAWREAFLSQIRKGLSNLDLLNLSLQITAGILSKGELPEDPLLAADLFINTAVLSSKALREGTPIPIITAKIQQNVRAGITLPGINREPSTLRDRGKIKRSQRPQPPGRNNLPIPVKTIPQKPADSNDPPHNNNPGGGP